MSTNSGLKARLARLGPVRDASPPPSFSGGVVTLMLKLEGSLDQPIAAARRLNASGLTLRSAHAAINRLAETRFAICRVAEAANIPVVAADLAKFNIVTARRRHLEPDLIAQVRARHGLSQREFAEVLGLDIDTLQNWEQGRNRPDTAALNLVMTFDRAPDVVTATTFEPVV